MKKILLLIFSSLSFLLAMSQNGGQDNENDAIRLTTGGMTSSGQLVIYVLNKQNCTAQIEVKQVGNGGGTVNITVQAGQTETVLFSSSGSSAKIQAKTATNCSGQNLEVGTVELVVNTATLPVKWAKRPAGSYNSKTNEVTVTFSVAEATSVNQFVIQVSKDGRSWQNVAVILPIGIEPFKTYTVKTKLH